MAASVWQIRDELWREVVAPLVPVHEPIRAAGVLDLPRSHGHCWAFGSYSLLFIGEGDTSREAASAVSPCLRVGAAA